MWHTAYTVINIKSDRKQNVQFRISGTNAYKVWLNGEFLWQRYNNRDAFLDRDIITVVLHKGYNKVLLKIHNQFDSWGYYFRVTDSKGNGIKDISFHSQEQLKKQLAADI